MVSRKHRNRLFVAIALIFFLTVIFVISIVQQQTSGIITQLTLDRARAANREFVNYITELKEETAVRAEIIAGDESIISALIHRDFDFLRRSIRNYALGMDFLAICDANGIVIARSHTDLVWDNISGYRGISQALETGKTTVSIEEVESNEYHLSIYASTPVFDNGRIIGIISCNFDLTNSDYVDLFKERTGCEAAIFLDDLRISTTITDENGNRITGTKAFDFVSKSVLKNQNDYLGVLDSYGTRYGVCYTPFLSDGEIIGMLFTGVDINSTLEKQRSMNLWIIFAALLGIIISVAIITVFNRTMNKYAEISERQFKQQILMSDISRSFLIDTETNILINETFKKIGEFLKIPQILCYWLDEDGVTLTCRNECIYPMLNLPSRLESKFVLMEPLLSIIKEFKPNDGKDAYLSSNDPVYKKAMAPYRVNFTNYITAPLFVKGKMVGIVDFSGEDSRAKWRGSDINLAVQYASILSGVFEREAMGKRTSIVENSPHLIFYADHDGNIAYTNPAVSKAAGYTRKEMRRGGFELLFGEETAEKIKNQFIPETIKEGYLKQEVVLLCKDGSRRILEITSFMMKDEIVAGIAVDLTELRMLQNKINA